MINRVVNTVLVLALFGACALGQDQGQSRTVASVSDVPVKNAPSTTSVRPRFESGDRSPVAIDQSSPYYWKTTPVGDSAQLLTLFCRACGVSKDTEEDVPLVSVLRDTLGDQSDENERVTYVWLLTCAHPRMGQRILSAIPFFYWRISKGSTSVRRWFVRPVSNGAELARLFCLRAAALTRLASHTSSVGCTPRGGDPNHVTRQIVGNYISAFAKGAKQGAVVTHSAQTPRQPRTINHRLSALASYFEYCIRRDTEDGHGPWKGRINPASGNPLTEELRHGTMGRDLPARQRQRDGFRRRIPRTLPKVLELTAIQKLIDSAGSYRDKAILILLSRAGQRIGDWSPVAGRHGILGIELEDIDRKRRFITARLKGTADSVWRALSSEHQKLFPTTSRCADDGTSFEIPDPQPAPANLVTEAMDSTSLVVFGQRAASPTRKRRTRAVVPEQASLFSLG